MCWPPYWVRHDICWKWMKLVSLFQIEPQFYAVTLIIAGTAGSDQLWLWRKQVIGGQYGPMVSIEPAAPGSVPSTAKKIHRKKIVDAAEVNQRCCVQESGKWLEDVDWTHLVLASGKLVLQNRKQESRLKLVTSCHCCSATAVSILCLRHNN